MRESSNNRRFTSATVTALLLTGSFLAFESVAQEVTPAQFRESALEALGGMDATGVAFSGSGYDACLGQAWSVQEGWARWELTDYHRVIDYDQGASRHNTLRRAGMDPGRIGGCGAQQDVDPVQQQGYVDPAVSWSDQLMIWLTPHGFIELLDDGQVEIADDDSGWRVTLRHNHENVDYTLIGDYNTAYELGSILTWVDDPVFGDMEVLAEFGPYQDHGDLSYPAYLNIRQGGFTTFHLDISEASLINDPLEAPGNSRGRPPAPAAPDPAYEFIGDGIIAIHGAYQSVAVAFEEFTMVIDGLQSDARVEQLIETVEEAFPGKPIHYVLSTHSHFDHASGLRQFAALGATIITHAMNVDFFRDALSTPRTLRPDSSQPESVPLRLQGIEGRFVISDGSGQSVELYTLGPSAHAADQIIAYLPSIKTIVEADILQPWINPVFGGGRHPFLVYLDEELNALGLDYESFVPIHVPPSPPLMERSALEQALSQ